MIHVKFTNQASTQAMKGLTRLLKSKLLGRVHLRALRTKATTAMLTSSTVPIATPAMMAAKVLSARSTS